MMLKLLVAAHPELSNHERGRILSLTPFKLINDAFDQTRQSNPHEYVSALFDALESGIIDHRLVELPPPLEVRDAFSGSDEHRRVCASVAAWLDSLGRGWTASELGCGDGQVDVMASDHRLAAEVGYTRVRKVVHLLENDVEVLMVPWVTCGLFGVLLTPHLKERNVETLMPELQERIKSVMRARRTPFVPEVEDDDE